MILWGVLGAIIGVVIGFIVSLFAYQFLKKQPLFHTPGPYGAWPRRLVGIGWAVVNPPAFAVILSTLFVLFPLQAMLENEELGRQLGIEAARILLDESSLLLEDLPPAKRATLQKTLEEDEVVDLDAMPDLLDALIQTTEPGVFCSRLEGVDKEECKTLLTRLNEDLKASRLKEAVLEELHHMDRDKNGLVGMDEIGGALAAASLPLLKDLCTQFIVSKVIGGTILVSFWIFSTLGFWSLAAAFARRVCVDSDSGPLPPPGEHARIGEQADVEEKTASGEEDRP